MEQPNEENGKSRGAAKCDDCGNIFTVAIPADGEAYIFGMGNCESCGGEDFTIIEADDLGLEKVD